MTSTVPTWFGDSLAQFGAFVDLGGGVQGLLHVADMGWSRVDSASQVVAPGEEITYDYGYDPVAMARKAKWKPRK